MFCLFHLRPLLFIFQILFLSVGLTRNCYEQWHEQKWLRLRLRLFITTYERMPSVVSVDDDLHLVTYPGGVLNPLSVGVREAIQ